MTRFHLTLFRWIMQNVKNVKKTVSTRSSEGQILRNNVTTSQSCERTPYAVVSSDFPTRFAAAENACLMVAGNIMIFQRISTAVMSAKFILPFHTAISTK